MQSFPWPIVGFPAQGILIGKDSGQYFKLWEQRMRNGWTISVPENHQPEKQWALHWWVGIIMTIQQWKHLINLEAACKLTENFWNSAWLNIKRRRSQRRQRRRRGQRGQWWFTRSACVALIVRNTGQNLFPIGIPCAGKPTIGQGKLCISVNYP